MRSSCMEDEGREQGGAPSGQASVWIDFRFIHMGKLFIPALMLLCCPRIFAKRHFLLTLAGCTVRQQHGQCNARRLKCPSGKQGCNASQHRAKCCAAGHVEG